jgi:hypothetical protein
MFTVEIETLGGASGTIVAECPSYNAAYFLATTVSTAPISCQSITIKKDGEYYEKHRCKQ